MDPARLMGMPVGTANSTAGPAKQRRRRRAAAGSAGPADFVVKPVETRRERKAFLEFPWQLYRDDPNWIPPLADEPEGAGRLRQASVL